MILHEIATESCRQPELFQGVTLEEYNALRARGKIDAYGFATNLRTADDEAASPVEAASGPTLPAAAPQLGADEQQGVKIAAGQVDPLG